MVDTPQVPNPEKYPVCNAKFGDFGANRDGQKFVVDVLCAQWMDFYQMWCTGSPRELKYADFFVDRFQGIDFVGGGEKFAYCHRN